MSEQKQDSTNDILWIMGGIFLLGCVFIYFFGETTKYLYLTLKLIQLKIITIVYPSNEFLEYIKYIEDRRIEDWTFAEVSFVGKRVGYWVNAPLIAIVAFLAYLVWNKNPMQKLKRKLNMQTLKESEQRLWPYIAPVVNVDLMKEEFYSGPYAMGMKPYEFAKKYHLLQEEKNVNSLDRKKTEKLFVSQLGKVFDGFNKMRKHEQALFLIFAAHGCGDKKGAMNAVNSIAISSAQVGIKKMPDFSSVEPLKKHLKNPEVIKVMERHAYVYTLLAQMIEFSRITGVFPSSYLVWLKPRDRTLWYVLNCVGRQVAYVEVSGIFGHWKAEQIAGKKLLYPFVGKAVDGLERALSEVKIV